MNAYRQAALLIAQLDRNAADELLDRLSPEQSQAIRDEVLRLEELNDSECEQAIDCFLSPNSECDPPSSSPLENFDQVGVTHDVEHVVDSTNLAGPLLASDHMDLIEREQEATRTNEHKLPATHAPMCATSLEELLQHDDSEIAQVVQHERSSIIAALIRSVPQKRAANLLRLLHSNLQSRVLSHLHVSQKVSAEIVEIIADCICDQLANDLPSGEDRIDALLGIFQELPEAEQALMLQSLQRDNPVLAQRLVTAVAENGENLCASHD